MTARILVVDDEPDLELLMRQKFRQKIRDNIFEFEFAHDGYAALEKLNSGKDYHLLLTDIRMPGMDGLTLLSKLRETNRHLKAIVISAYADLQNIRTAMNRGAFDFITKPVDFTDLEITIAKTLDEYRVIKEGLEAQINLAQAQLEKEQAVASGKFKQQFLANMSHEIRTPLNAVAGIANLLLNNNPREDQLTYLNTMKQASQNLLNIINDILDLSKIEAGKITLEETDFDIHEMVSGVYRLLHLKAAEKKINFNYKIDPCVPRFLKGDSLRLSQVLINLTGNAIKFTPEGGEVIIAVKHTVAADGNDVEFTVKDSGIGISAEQLDRIFESFTQASSDTTRKYGGTGLGLTISRELLQLMNSKLNVESKPDEGTVFSFTVNLKEGNVLTDDQDHSADNHFARPLHILLAEDQPMNQMVAVDTLKSLFRDIKIDIAENGAEALNLIDANNYDLVLMDIHMPVMDGYEAVRQIRSSGKNATLPVIALTANVIREEIEACIEIGMNDHLSKPFDPAVMKAVILQHVNK